MRRAWLVLVASGVLEAVWATSLGMSDGLTVLAPSIVFLASYLLSMWGLAVAMRSLPLSVSYAVWVAIGAVLTVAWAMTSGAEPVGVVRVLLLVGVIGCVVGLKALGSPRLHRAAPGQAGQSPRT